MRTEFGTSDRDLIRVIEMGPPYIVRFHWAGGETPRERRIVTEALAACFGAQDLGHEQTIERSQGATGSLEYRIKYMYWLLRIFDLSLGFTHGWEQVPAHLDGAAGNVATTSTYRISLRVDRSRYRDYDEL